MTGFQNGCKKGATPAEKIQRMSVHDPESGCTLWIGSINNNSRGRSGANGSAAFVTTRSAACSGVSGCPSVSVPIGRRAG